MSSEANIKKNKEEVNSISDLAQYFTGCISDTDITYNRIGYLGHKSTK